LKPVPFRFHLLQQAIESNKTIYICEGEKDCLAMERMGAFATCNSGGAGKFSSEYAKFFTGANVIIIADRDEAGEKHALDVEAKLQPYALSISIRQARVGKDAYDHLAAGCGIDEFLPFVEGGLATQVFDEGFQMVHLEFLWEPYLPKGKIMLFDADGGVGKTAMLLGVAASFSNGLVPVSLEQGEPIRTLYLHRAEDESEELHTVYLASGGKSDYISYYSTHDLLFDADGLRRLRATIIRDNIGLVIVDALYYFIQGIVKETADALQVLPVLERLKKVASDTGACIIDVRHTRKGIPNESASAMGMGSVQFRNSHRGCLVARSHPEEKGLVVVVDDKGSLLAERGEPFGFRRTGRYGSIEWVPDVDNPFEKRRGGSRGPEATTASAAAEAILAYLKIKPNFEAPVNEIVAHVIDEVGCHRATVFRAKKLLKTLDRMHDGKKLWALDILAEGNSHWWAD
jgi:5S rRNA maturation endonuclease (ribonuclease M5)